MAKNYGGKREQQIKIMCVTDSLDFFNLPVRALTSEQFEKCMEVLSISSPCKPVFSSFSLHIC